jgi:hypothetical protein
MRKWSSLLILGLLLASPSYAAAQTEITLASLAVQLWPEYDQPTMLVIYDFELAPETELPARVTFRIPQEANLIAMASLQGSNLLNAPYEGPVNEGGLQVFTVVISTQTRYHFEYYQPLGMDGNTRRFTYLWDGSYAVDGFSISILQPVDMLSLTTEPVLEPATGSDGLTHYAGEPVNLAAGEQFVLRLEYEKSSDALIVPAQDLQPSAPVDANTSGRISIGHYMPYILGGVGLILILGGLVYYWQSGSKGSGKPRNRRRAYEESEESDTSVYCPQCGTRAKMNDHFCRVCGTRLRKKE